MTLMFCQAGGLSTKHQWVNPGYIHKISFKTQGTEGIVSEIKFDLLAECCDW